MKFQVVTQEFSQNMGLFSCIPLYFHTLSSLSKFCSSCRLHQTMMPVIINNDLFHLLHVSYYLTKCISLGKIIFCLPRHSTQHTKALDSLGAERPVFYVPFRLIPREPKKTVNICMFLTYPLSSHPQSFHRLIKVPQHLT